MKSQATTTPSKIPVKVMATIPQAVLRQKLPSESPQLS